MQDLGYANYYCNSEGMLKSLENFSFNESQKNPLVKNIEYIQNFISIHKDKIGKYKNIINTL